jgi:putative nucleotidyltransferase with HDIG domain
MHVLPKAPPLPKVLRDLFDAKLAAGEIELPFLPDTAAKVLDASNDVDCDSRTLADLIQRDQALAAHVLNVSNSAAYAPKEPIVSLQQAISRLGIQAICDIAIAVSVQGRVFRIPGYQVQVRRMWQHSAMAGVYAKEIARLRRFNVEGAFSCGLMHDVGKPVVMQAFLDILGQMTEKRVPYKLLESAMDAFHAYVGGLLVEKWSLPPWVKASITYHHEYPSAPEYREDVMCTHLADLLSHWAMSDESSEDDFDFTLPVLGELSLYRDDVELLLARRSEVLDVAEAFL